MVLKPKSETLIKTLQAKGLEEINNISSIKRKNCIKRKKTQTATQRTAGPPALQRIHFALGVKKDVKTQP